MRHGAVWSAVNGHALSAMGYTPALKQFSLLNAIALAGFNVQGKARFTTPFVAHDPHLSQYTTPRCHLIKWVGWTHLLLITSLESAGIVQRTSGKVGSLHSPLSIVATVLYIPRSL